MFYLALGRAWSLISGPITMLLVTRFFTPVTQGYFYTFGSVMGLQVFFEMGFTQCIVQFASHEFAHLRFGANGAIEGDPVARSRLISLGRLSVKWYAAMSLLAVVAIGAGGYCFFQTKHDPSIAWGWPWWCLCVSAGLSWVLLPLGALLEGEGLHYEFAVSTAIPSNADVNFVCVEASLPDLTEDSIANNIFCVAMKDEFLMPEMYPNPVKDVINIAFILPFEDQVTIDVVNSMGSFIREIYNGNGKEGYNRLTTDVSTLNNGVYTVRIYFRDKILRKKFVKL